MDLTLLPQLLQMIWVDLLLSGDNALVIAMATRNLPPQQQRIALYGGLGIAVALRVAGAFVAGALLTVPFLTAICGAALLYIAYKLVAPSALEENVDAKAGFWAAIVTIGVADFSMSTDNVIAIAGIAHGHWGLMALGIAISIPFVLFGSVLITKMLTKLPLLVWAGAGVLGWVAGDIIAKDRFVSELAGGEYVSLLLLAPIVGAALVLLAGAAARFLGGRDEPGAMAAA